ncbi:siderophore-interacting protein [Erwinia sp. P6884]|uniref:siderophore-interacting protein n=1 Tax=Erwinia sp. P6884 TaxID=3141450 RepID=UPI0031887AA8
MPETQPGSRLPQRVRNELRIRPVTVVSKRLIAGQFYRIEVGGEALQGFASAGFDDHVKLFFPDAVSGELPLPAVTPEGIEWPEGVRPAARDYTPLSFDPEKGLLTLDFYLHEAGLASDWVTQATPGDKLAVGGPRGSLVVPEDYAFQLYVCDETGLPAFRRRQQTISGQSLRLFAWADEAVGQAYLGDPGNIEVTWLGSGEMNEAAVAKLITRFDELALPDEDYFIWLTGEGTAVKTLRDYFITQRERDAERVRAVAYWHLK